MKICCGILLYRIKNGEYEFFLVLPNSFYNLHHWSIPKGRMEEGETKIKTAIREFNEETGAKLYFKKKELLSLKEIKQNQHKIVYAYAYEFDLGDNFVVNSNKTTIEFPKGSGRYIIIPEIERGRYFTYSELKEIIVPKQLELIDRFLKGKNAQEEI